MLLCIDIGNTNIVLGIYKDKTLLAHWRLATRKDATADEYGILLKNLLQQKINNKATSPQNIKLTDLKGIIIASVVPYLTSVFKELSHKIFQQKPLIVEAGIKTGLQIQIDNPREVGADRIVNAVAAFKKYPELICIIDFGTATTFDVVTQKGIYIGGAIAPGLKICAEALSKKTAKLPQIELKFPPKAISKNTTNAIQSGLLYGYTGLIEGLLNRFRQELKAEIKIIATGGLAQILAPEIKSLDIIEPNLTLEGLKIIWDMNSDQNRECHDNS
jgi:type III pantothenate kinase